MTYRVWTKEPAPPRTEKEKQRIYEVLRRARDLRDEDERNEYNWSPTGEEVSELRDEREDEIG